MERKMWNLKKGFGLLGVFLAAMFCLSVKVHADNLTLYAPNVEGYISVLSSEGPTGEALPAGVAYDAATNTLTLNNATIKEVSWNGNRNLQIKLIGRNVVEDGWDVFQFGGNGTVTISGGGSLECEDARMLFCFTNHSYQDLINVVLENITIKTNASTIYYGTAENLTISNSRIFADRSAQYDSVDAPTIALTTGMYLSDNTLNSWNNTIKDNIIGGKLVISNSTIELKGYGGMGAALACNQYQLSGVRYYTGDGKAEYQMRNLFREYDFRQLYEGNYLLITPEDKNLPILSDLDDDTSSSAHGSISLPAGEKINGGYEYFYPSGRKITVKVTPDEGYEFDYLLVNGKKVSKTSFTMPAKDTVVRGVFKKKNVKIKKISLTAQSTKIAAGKKVSLTAKLTPSKVTNSKLKWSTSNKKYAVVSSKGVVTTKRAGAGKTVTITARATDGSRKQAKIRIKILKNAVKKITLKAPKTLTAGKKAKITAKVTAESGANKTLVYSCSNKKYATVNSKGTVTAKKAGKGKTVTITVRAVDGSGKKASVKIKIK